MLWVGRYRYWTFDAYDTTETISDMKHSFLKITSYHSFKS